MKNGYNSLNNNMYILEELERNPNISQKLLSEKAGISVGLTNLFIKRLAKKGFLKIKRINGKSLAYMLTSEGIKEKARLTREYLQFSIEHYKKAKYILLNKFTELKTKGILSAAVYTTPEWAEIAYLISKHINFNILCFVIDGGGKMFFDVPVKTKEELKKIKIPVIGIGGIKNTNGLKIDYILETGFEGIN